MKAVRAWLIGLLAVGLVGGGAAAALGVVQAFPGFQLFGVSSETRTTQIINSVTRKEQVVLLSLGIQGITKKEQGCTKVLGVEVPGSERAVFMQYGFNAKVGIDGKDVTIVHKGEKQYLVSVPKFMFIGHSDEHFELAVENNGVLSWTSPEIDKLAMINAILNDEAQRGYVDQNQEILKDQAKAFYTGVISGIDQTISLSFEFR
ncbi:hypothetical protein [Propionicimonas sp.]|uniref:hypothetical protein n=1 Tax=Propionicimonas sp. TaxID=1955623 RepID=UPI00181DB0F7|nr:hypothetical protein [Propionicimonas sp.]MBU3976120.1 hypothetical protein [Actinomycetota bacterium]MBA3020933.1 hypothetical protein [Propionicimonas sp.]MBU3985310.1 hypothetical protein [Actinomycetota bacterium]MBU4008300.1 hypothetical protein [Actinomycetota bacterium]MBU4064486.1 hypothetical protein [Actinomycetota bacterium]